MVLLFFGILENLFHFFIFLRKKALFSNKFFDKNQTPQISCSYPTTVQIFHISISKISKELFFYITTMLFCFVPLFAQLRVRDFADDVVMGKRFTTTFTYI